MQTFRIFFSHRTEDQDQVKALQAELRAAFSNLVFEDVGARVPHADDWQAHAEPLIQQADLVVCVVGRTTCVSAAVTWELQQALRHRRPVLVRQLSDTCAVPDVVGDLPRKLWRLEEVAQDVMAALLPVALMPWHAKGEAHAQLVMAQYTAMVTSWEALVNRRQTVNAFYMSACAALLTALGVLVPLTKDSSGLSLPLGIALVAGVGSVIAHVWHTTLVAYGTLSAAKGQVVTTLEQDLPVRLFEAEWLALQSRRYTSTTRMDQVVADVFRGLFICLLIGATTWALVGLRPRLSCPPPAASAPVSSPAASAASAVSAPTAASSPATCTP